MDAEEGISYEGIGGIAEGKFQTVREVIRQPSLLIQEYVVKY